MLRWLKIKRLARSRAPITQDEYRFMAYAASASDFRRFINNRYSGEWIKGNFSRNTEDMFYLDGWRSSMGSLGIRYGRAN